MSSFLTPQVYIEDPINAFINSRIVLEETERQEQLPEQVLSEKRLEPIYEKLQTETEVFGKVIMSPITGYKGYVWDQEGDMITIRYAAKYPLVENEIEIDNTKIDTQFLSGIWYGPVKQYEYKIKGKDITITLQVDKFWPILIRGGSMDIDSAFQLANYCENSGFSDEGLILLKYAANRYHDQATLALAEIAFNDSRSSEALYWFSRYSPLKTNLSALTRVAFVLVDFEGDEARIAENLLIQLFLAGEKDVLFHLGYLYLRHPGDFKPNDELAIEYFTQAANNGNVQAMNTLGKCYMNGICVQKDVEKGKEYLKKSGELAMKMLQEGENNGTVVIENENSQEQKPKENKDDNPYIDVAISAGIVAAVGLGAAFLYRRIFRK